MWVLVFAFVFPGGESVHTNEYFNRDTCLAAVQVLEKPLGENIKVEFRVKCERARARG